ncbi:hypothetical protein [Rodentibacter trehalosifermentans]|uniref:hypothetical protein n=1 Tax=Rodentibacter trehalosifermentans TaxID=1908263 RepID=UPI0009866362|nr:hypothetical protein [Rodentibacter trehalosifermentans]OOF46740.1 hypothetical protein BKK53_11770 [Rodentibacter trehalosifermentans]
MIYEYQYLIFGSTKPTLEDVRKQIASDEWRYEESQRDHLSSVAENIVKKHSWEWELGEDDNIFIAICPKNKTDKLEVFDVSLRLEIEATAYSMGLYLL